MPVNQGDDLRNLYSPQGQAVRQRPMSLADTVQTGVVKSNLSKAVLEGQYGGGLSDAVQRGVPEQPEPIPTDVNPASVQLLSESGGSPDERINAESNQGGGLGSMAGPSTSLGEMGLGGMAQAGIVGSVLAALASAPLGLGPGLSGVVSLGLSAAKGYHNINQSLASAMAAQNESDSVVPGLSGLHGVAAEAENSLSSPTVIADLGPEGVVPGEHGVDADSMGSPSSTSVTAAGNAGQGGTVGLGNLGAVDSAGSAVADSEGSAVSVGGSGGFGATGDIGGDGGGGGGK